MAQLFGEERCKLDTALAEGFVTALKTAHVQSFLNITLAQGKSVGEPKGVLDAISGKRCR
ncbi:hypothetical protein GCM10008949_27900 [Deinococcus humi]|nr:hypothetical protein GCM10008949_27900 [Deinococcus humi]